MFIWTYIHIRNVFRRKKYLLVYICIPTIFISVSSCLGFYVFLQCNDCKWTESRCAALSFIIQDYIYSICNLVFFNSSFFPFFLVKLNFPISMIVYLVALVSSFAHGTHLISFSISVSMKWSQFVMWSIMNFDFPFSV